MGTRKAIATERDLAFLAELGEVGLMTAAMIVTRYFGACSDKSNGERSFRRRMKLFIELGYVRAERVPFAGNKAGLVTIYRLTTDGAKSIAALTGRQPSRAGASRDLNPVTVPHRLGVVATRLAFDDAHRALGLSCPEWLFEYDLALQPGPAAGNEKKFVLYESFCGERKRVACWPDAAARIRPPDASEHELLAYFEYDRSTETTGQFAAKVAGYRLLVSEQRYRRHWPQLMPRHTLRVLTVVRSEQRLRNLMEAIAQIDGAELFRFAVANALLSTASLTQPIWQRVDGQKLAIFRASK